jgi:hypothetical protein
MPFTKAKSFSLIFRKYEEEEVDFTMHIIFRAEDKNLIFNFRLLYQEWNLVFSISFKNVNLFFKNFTNRDIWLNDGKGLNNKCLKFFNPLFS